MTRSKAGRLAQAGLVGIALLAAPARWLACNAAPQTEKLRVVPQSVENPTGCQAALVAGQEKFVSQRAKWTVATGIPREIRKFGKASEDAERRALAAFDAEVEEGGSCARERTALQEAMRQDVWAEFLAQRQISEQAVAHGLHTALVQRMEKRGGPLRTHEKLRLLRSAIGTYKRRVEQQLPAWAAGQGDPEVDGTEKRLGLLQFAVEDSPSGRALRARWASQESKRLNGQRAHGFSVSVDPGMRVLVRPRGLGNLQFFSSGPVGPPNHPATVNVGIMNDGSMADVYREHPVPPLVSFQPAAKVNLNLR